MSTTPRPVVEVTLDEECDRPSCLCHAMRALGLAFGHYRERA